MNWYRKRVTVGAAMTAIGILGGMTAADAATLRSAQNAVPGSTPVPCTLNLVWLRLFAATGEHCYTGNGTLTVNLVGVRTERTTGEHTICLLIAPSAYDCETGPATLVFNPPATVLRVTINTASGQAPANGRVSPAAQP